MQIATALQYTDEKPVFMTSLYPTSYTVNPNIHINQENR